MKVVKEGRKQKGWAKEYTCTGSGNKGGGCGAVLLVEEGDLFYTMSTALNETDYYVTFRCPECGVLTDIRESDTPCSVRSLPSSREWMRSRGFSSDS